jgi:hypothetical protein
MGMGPVTNRQANFITKQPIRIYNMGNIFSSSKGANFA